MRMENDPDLRAQQDIIDHHPHHGFPAHGHIRKAPQHMLEVLRREKGGKMLDKKRRNPKEIL